MPLLKRESWEPELSSCAAKMDDPTSATIGPAQQLIELCNAAQRELVIFPVTAAVDRARDGRVELSSREGSERRLWGSLRVLLAVIRLRPSALIIMEPVCHLWPLRLVKFLQTNVFLVESDQRAGVAEGGRPFGRVIGSWNRRAIRQFAGGLVVQTATSRQLRRAGMRSENIVEFKPQVSDRLAPRIKKRVASGTLDRLAIVVQDIRENGIARLRHEIAELRASEPHLRIEILLRHGCPDPLGSERVGNVKVTRCMTDDARLLRLRAADLAVIWSDQNQEQLVSDLALQAILAGSPVLVDYRAGLPDWVEPATRRVDLMSQGAISGAVSRLCHHPTHLRRLTRSAALAAENLFDRESSLAGQLLGLMQRQC
ncbi:MAG: hypothetical protein AAGE80_13960 [Pseudomonadota bacterium]